MSEVLTIRIDKRTKEKIKKHKINVSEIVRAAIRTEIGKREEMELGEALREAGEILRKIPEDEIVKALRQSRDEKLLTECRAQVSDFRRG